MDYVKIMEQFLNLNESTEERIINARNNAVSISAKAANLLNFFQLEDDEEVMRKIISDKTEIYEKLAAFILPVLYLCHNLGLKGDDLEAMIYSEILKECNKHKSVQ